MMKKTILTLALMALCSTASFADITPAPEISVSWQGAHSGPGGDGSVPYRYDEVYVFDYLFTAIGEGDVHLYMNGEEVANPYCFSPEVAMGYMQFEPVTWLFTATAQSEGCEMSETTKEYVRPGLPRFTIYHDEESDSFWMELEGDGESIIRYQTSFADPYDRTNWIHSDDWEEYSGPFKVWYDPQDIGFQFCVIDVYVSNSSGSSEGLIMDLKDEIDEFGIYGYDYYYPEYGFYCKASTNWDLSNIDNREGICNKYIDPESHAPCYSGDLIIPNHYVIHKKTFVNCPGLTSIVLPNSDLAIGQGAFAGCTGLESITCKSVNPPSTSNSFADESIFSQATLFVPYESLEAYKAHEEWGKFVRIVPFRGAGPGDVNGDGTLSIGDVTDMINQMLNGDDIPAYCDVNGDGNVTISDVTILTGLLLNGN